ncbi:hypothetical protein AB0J72_06175 [Dactylosporangium sp. NPDC049742]|uniref:hypothetical protein n=1 Tax=Dactylosporangium sp. NPDC049742 TaxID=3154737 RepID=UPI0034155A6D
MTLVVAELGQPERAMGRSFASGISLYSQEQRFALPAGDLTRLGTIRVQDAQVGVLEESSQGRTARLDTSPADVPAGAIIVDPPAVLDRLRPRLGSGLLVRVARLRCAEKFGERLTLLAVATHGAQLVMFDRWSPG